MIRHTIYLIVIGVFLCKVSSSEVKQKAAEKPKQLSSEVIEAIEGNQKTIDSVHTLQGTITRNSTHYFREKESRQLKVKEKIWYDGIHSRQDIIESKFVGKETEPLLVEEFEGGGQAHFSPPPVGKIEINSAESMITYNPPTNSVSINPIKEDDARRIIRFNSLFRFQSIMGRTLREVVLRCAEKDYYFNVKNETVDGDDCLLLECYFAEYEILRKVWVVPLKGYCIKRVQLLQKGMLFEDYINTLKKYSPGLWWYDSVKERLWKSTEKGVLPDMSLELSLDSLNFNEPIDPEIFTVWGMGLSPKTRIKDEIQGITYTLAIDGKEASEEEK